MQAIEDRVQAYIQGVVDGTITVGNYVRLAVERYLKDREKGHERGLSFDEEAAKHAIVFIETYIHHTTGRWNGQRFTLEQWQLFIMWNLFGFMREDGHRRYRIAYNELGRKNGKSTFAAAINNYLLIADDEARAECYAIATKRDQSKIPFSESQRQVRTSADLRRFAKVLTHSITVPETFSKYEALGADTSTLDGLNVHGCCVDEVHMHKSRELWEKVVTATGARTQPLIFAITTAGFDRQTICWELREYGVNILEGNIQDDGYFAFIATLDDGDDWQDESVWIKSNPNLGVSVSLGDLREECERVKNDPRGLNSFLRYKLNRWTEHYESWLTPDQWARNNHGPIDFETLRERPCVMALDLAARKDTTAAVLVWPPENGEGLYIIKPVIWIPRDTLFERDRQERVPWIRWMNEGLITTTSGPATDVREVVQKIAELDEQFTIGDLVYDRWMMDLMAPFLKELGWSDDPDDPYAQRFMIEFGQGYKSMSPAARVLEELALAGRLSHGGHEVLAWMMSCVALVQDDADNIKPSKRKSTGRIDAVVALIMALYHAHLEPAPEPTSIYDKGGERETGILTI